MDSQSKRFLFALYLVWRTLSILFINVERNEAVIFRTNQPRAIIRYNPRCLRKFWSYLIAVCNNCVDLLRTLFPRGWD